MAHLQIPESVKLIVAMGELPLETTQPGLTKASKKSQFTSKDDEPDKGGIITSWRGFIAPGSYAGRPVFSVVHIDEFVRDPSKRLVARLDWLRVGQWFRGFWPQEIPDRTILRSSLADLTRAFDDAEQAGAVVIDTEFSRDTKLLSLIGLGWRRADGVISGLQLEWAGNEEDECSTERFYQTARRSG